MSKSTDLEATRVPPDSAQRSYWLRTQHLTAVLLLVWLGVTFIPAYFAREIDFLLFGWPFSYWYCSQGALLVFLAIVWFYAWRMDRLEAGLPEPD